MDEDPGHSHAHLMRLRICSRLHKFTRAIFDKDSNGIFGTVHHKSRDYRLLETGTTVFPVLT